MSLTKTTFRGHIPYSSSLLPHLLSRASRAPLLSNEPLGAIIRLQPCHSSFQHPFPILPREAQGRTCTCTRVGMPPPGLHLLCLLRLCSESMPGQLVKGPTQAPPRLAILLDTPVPVCCLTPLLK
jgi:hypothetical protein